MYYSPLDVVFRALETNAHVLEPLLIANDAVSKTLSIVYGGSQLVLKQGSEGMAGVVPSLLCGTIAGCGGRVIFNALGLYDPNWAFQCPEQLRRPSTAMLLSFAAAALYTANHFGLGAAVGSRRLSHDETIAVIFAMILVVSLAAHARSGQQPVAKRTPRGGGSRSKKHQT